MLKTFLLGAALSTAAATGAWAGSELQDRTADCCETPWGSRIALRPPVDNAWTGKWELTAVYAPGPGRLMQAPVVGVVMEVTETGDYTLDYAGAHFADLGAAPGNGFEIDGQEVPPPVWAMPPGATAPECGGEGPVFSGKVMGTLRARFNLGLPGREGVPLLASGAFLSALPDLEASDAPKMTCEDKETPLAALAGPPLGTGGSAGVQPYDYALYHGGETWVLMGRNAQVTYVFTRAGS